MIKYQIKYFFGSLLLRSYCTDCGKHIKPTYKWINDFGNNETCLICECGMRWHEEDNTGHI